jgi:hypothetical protein
LKIKNLKFKIFHTVHFKNLKEKSKNRKEKGKENTNRRQLNIKNK